MIFDRFIDGKNSLERIKKAFQRQHSLKREPVHKESVRYFLPEDILKSFWMV